MIALMVFGNSMETVLHPTLKSKCWMVLQNKLTRMKPEMTGGTRFFDSVAQSLQELDQLGLASPDQSRWLVCLTDGDDIGSSFGNRSGERVTEILKSKMPKNLNMVMITVGQLQERNLQVMEGWVSMITRSGGVGQLLAEKSAVDIRKAFDVVAEVLAVDVGGATEC